MTVDVGKSTDVKKQEHDIKNYRKRVNVSDTGNSDENLKQSDVMGRFRRDKSDNFVFYKWKQKTKVTKKRRWLLISNRSRRSRRKDGSKQKKECNCVVTVSCVSKIMRLSKRKDTRSARICQLTLTCVNEITHEKSDPSIIRKFHYPNSFVQLSFRTSYVLRFHTNIFVVQSSQICTRRSRFSGFNGR